MKIQLLTLLIMFVFALPAAFGQHWSKKFVKQDILYMKGDYKLAREQNHNLKIKIKTTLGPQNAYTALAQFKDAKYHAGAGYFNAYRRSIYRGFSIAQGTTGRNNPDYARIVLEGITVLVKYGDYAQAEVLLNQVSQILTDYNNKDVNLEHKKDYLLAQVYAGQGRYRESLDLFIKVRDYMADLNIATEVQDNFISVDKHKSRKLSAFEIKQNKRSYASYLHLTGKLYTKTNQPAKADSAFNVARVWISNNLSGKDYSMLQYEFQQIKMNAASDSSENSIARLDQLIKRAEGSLNKNQELVLDMKYTLLEWYQKKNKSGKYNSLKAHLANINEKYYDKKNINQDRLAFIVLKEKGETKTDPDRINAAKSLLKGSASLPEFHELRIEILQFLLAKSKEGGLQAESEHYLLQIEAVKKGLYGENAPIVSS